MLWSEFVPAETGVNKNLDREEPAATSSPHNQYQVVDIIDGDTIRLNIDDTIESVRLVGLNTPETDSPYRKEECFGQEATEEARRILTNQTVTFTHDPSQAKRDQYDRLLGYIFLTSGENFAEKMIRNGFGYEYTFKTPYQYQADFQAAEQYAKSNQLGLWAAGVCD